MNDAADNQIESGIARSRAPLWLLAMLIFLATFGMHAFVPALPIAAHDLGASIAAMQMTVSLYIFGLAVGQLIYGPVSDRFGRRTVLLVGLAVYAGAGLAAALAPTVRFLIAARLLQSLGGCAGMVLGRAIVRDTSLPAETGRRLALMNLMVMAGPGLSPLIGGAVAAATGWRSVLYVLSACGLAGFASTWLLLPETGSSPSRGASLVTNYWQLVRSRVFLCYSLGGGCATTSIYAFVASAPFIFVQQLHRPTHEVGIYIAILLSGVWLGSALTGRLITRMPMDRLLVRANVLSVVAAAILLALVLTAQLSVVVVVGAMFIFSLGAGIVAPTALAQAISVNPHVIGSASGLYGFAQMAVAALCTGIAGIGENPALSASAVLLAAGVVAQLSFRTALARSNPAS